jgi:hypothetical protein
MMDLTIRALEAISPRQHYEIMADSVEARGQIKNNTKYCASKLVVQKSARYTKKKKKNAPKILPLPLVRVLRWHLQTPKILSSQPKYVALKSACVETVLLGLGSGG